MTDQPNSSYPLVSVIIPAFNREEFIAKSIESVLTQTYQNFILIIIDDGSIDKTVSIAEKYLIDNRVTIIRNSENIGIAATRNKAILSAQGKYIAMLDSDDMWVDKEKLHKQVSFLETNTDHVMIGGGIVYIDVNGNHLKTMVFPTKDGEIRKTILRRNTFAQSTLLCRTQALIQAGLYSNNFMVSDDYDLWLRLGLKWKFANMTDVVTGYRIHTENITNKKRLLAARETLDIVRANINKYPHPLLGLTKAYLRVIYSIIKHYI